MRQRIIKSFLSIHCNLSVILNMAIQYLSLESDLQKILISPLYLMSRHRAGWTLSCIESANDNQSNRKSCTAALDISLHRNPYSQRRSQCCDTSHPARSNKTALPALCPSLTSTCLQNMAGNLSRITSPFFRQILSCLQAPS